MSGVRRFFIKSTDILLLIRERYVFVPDLSKRYIYLINLKFMFEETLDDQSIRSQGGGSRTLQDVLSNGYSFSIGDAFNLGMKLFQERLWSYVGFTLIQFSASALANKIPIVGSLIGLVLSPTLSAGPFYVADKTFRKQNPEFENYFDGFKYKIRDLILNYLILIGLLILVCLPVVALLFVFGGLSVSALDFNNIASWFSGSLVLSIIMIFLVLMLLVGSLLVFNTPLLLFENLGPWGAIESSAKIVLKNLGLILVLILSLVLLNILGAVVLLVGLLFTIPLSACIVYAAYTLIFDKTIE